MLTLFRILRLKRSIGWAALLTAAALLLSGIPLFNVLGYEFCLVMALLSSLAALHLTSVVVATARREDDSLLVYDSPVAAWFALAWRAALANLLLLLMPLLVICLNALRVQNCNFGAGLAFFVLLPVFSSIFATTVGLVTANLINRPLLATLASVALLLLSVSWGLWRFYSAPPINAFDPFVGYFAGSLYDEDISIGAPLLLYRLFNLLLASGLLLLAARHFDPAQLQLRLRPRHRPRGTALAGVALLAAATVLFSLRAPLGFAVDSHTIRQALGGIKRTSHFNIIYPKELKPDALELIAQDHEFRYHQLGQFFGRSPGRITSYIFRSDDERRLLMGAGRTNIAKPWRKEIYLRQGPFPLRVLKHELAHIFAGQFGDPLFGVSLRWQGPRPHVNVGLIEGVAVAADWRPYLNEMDGHQLAAALFELKLAPPLKGLFGYGFLTGAASRSYTLAGSFCRFLAQRYGNAKLLQAYRSAGQFQQIYNRSLEQLLQQWRTFLAKRKLSPKMLQLAQERYRRPSIFRRVCSHEVANLAKQRDLLHKRGQLEQASAVANKLCLLDPGEPGHQLSKLELSWHRGDIDGARTIAEQILQHPAASAALKRTVEERLGDIAWKGRDLDAAALRYSKAADGGSLPFGRRLLHLKRWAISQPARLRNILRQYLVPPPGEERNPALDLHHAHRIVNELPSSGLGHYLLGKQLAGQKQWAEAAAAMRGALNLGLPTADFELEAFKVLCICLYISKQYLAAEQTLRRLSAMESRAPRRCPHPIAGESWRAPCPRLLKSLSAGDLLWVQRWLGRVSWRLGKTPAAMAQ